MKRVLKVGVLLGAVLAVGLTTLVLLSPGRTRWNTARLGTPIDHGGFRYTVKSAEISDTIDISVGQFKKIATGRPYLLTELRVENGGDARAIDFPVSIALFESDGKRARPYRSNCYSAPLPGNPKN